MIYFYHTKRIKKEKDKRRVLMRLKRKLFSALLTICLLLTALPVTTMASSKKLTYTAKTSGSGNSIKVKKVTYDTDDGQKELEIDFSTKVTWRSTAKVSSIKDNKGVKYTGTLIDKDDDECDIVIPKLKTGRTYTITITGIKKKGTTGYRTLTLTAKVPAASSTSNKKVTVKKVEVDTDNTDHDSYKTEIDIDFTTKVTWRSNAKVTSVKDNTGKSYTGILTDKDDDECEVYIKNIKYGKTYTIKISGVKVKGASAYETITVTAKVPAISNKLTVKKVEYDADYDDKEYTVDFEFNKKVVKKSSSYILIKDSSGKAYSSKSSYIEWDGDECEVHLSKKLTVGKTYTYQIVNVKASGESSYKTLKGTFVARD